jgi:hypothetical protein
MIVLVSLTFVSWLSVDMSVTSEKLECLVAQRTNSLVHAGAVLFGAHQTQGGLTRAAG